MPPETVNYTLVYLFSIHTYVRSRSVTRNVEFVRHELNEEE